MSSICDPFNPVITAQYSGEQLPFPEWVDQEVNSENWDTLKPKLPQKDKYSIATTLDAQYEDPQQVKLPPSLVEHKWKRAAEVFKNADIIMFTENPIYPDLISGNKHLLHSEFMRNFISSIGTLQYLGNTRQSQIEHRSPTFTPTTENSPWRPWHHIYSLNKAGKGEAHNPAINHLGKYIVRIYWLGCWRKIYVDDLIPLDKSYHTLLPSLELPREEIEKIERSKIALLKEMKQMGDVEDKTIKKIKLPISEKRVVQLWPFLLAKALLKIACLTWYGEKEIVDFDIIQCLTGWIPVRISTKGLSATDVWEIFSAYSEHFSWIDEKPSKGALSRDRLKTLKKDESHDTTTSASQKSKESKSSKSSKKSKEESKGGDAPEGTVAVVPDDGIASFHLVASFEDLRSLPEDAIVDISPCWSHQFLIDQTRDIPLAKPPSQPSIEFWKTFRWKAWAILNGIIPPDPDMNPIKCLKFVSFFRKCSEHTIYEDQSITSSNIEKSVVAIENIINDLSSKTVKKGKDKGTKPTKKGQPKEEKASKGSSKSKSSKEGKKKKEVILPPDPSIWVDFTDVASKINFVIVYFKPSRFRFKHKITNILPGRESLEPKPKTGAPKGRVEPSEPIKITDWKTIYASFDLQESRNEPFYIFVDSVDYKLILVNLMQVGNIESAEKVSLKDTNVNTSLKNFCEVAKNDCDILEPNTNSPRSLAHVIVETYDWQTNKIGEMISLINCYGSKASIFEIKPGRHVLRVWIKSDTNFTTYILSDTSIVTGCLADVLDAMTEESHRFLEFSDDVSSSFGKLVAAFGCPEFSESLRNFYRSYKPTTILNKSESNLIHEVLLKEFNTFIDGCFTGEEVKIIQRALQVLFLQPYPIIPNNSQPLTHNETVSIDGKEEDLDVAKLKENSASVIQSLFRGIHVRKLFSFHSSTQREYYSLFDALKLVYKQVFSVAARPTACSSLLRKFFENSKMELMRDKYELHKDLQNVVSSEKFVGTGTVNTNEWAPICRYIFHIDSIAPQKIKIDLFCDIKNFVVRVINNDNSQEIKRFTNNVCLANYESNVFGYTVLCYGWTSSPKKVNWKLYFTSIKRSHPNILIIPEVKIQTINIRNNYIPNAQNLIGRWLINIKANVLLTLRVATCYDKVKLHIKIIDESGEVINQILGTGQVVLPALMLQYTKDLHDETRLSKELEPAKLSKSQEKKGESRPDLSDVYRKSKRISTMKLRKRDTIRPMVTKKENQEQVFIIEGYVMDDSWPLTKDEWLTVEALLRNQLLDSRELASEPESRRGRSAGEESIKKRFERYLKMDKPYWSLYAVYNSGDKISITKDTSYEERFKLAKRSWYQKDPNRYLISQEIRNLYLQTNCIIEEIEPTEVGRGDSESAPRNKSSNIVDVKLTEYQQSEDKKEMTSTKPRCLFPPLLPYDLTPFMIKNPEDVDISDRNVKTEADFADDSSRKIKELEEFRTKEKTFQEEFNSRLSEQISNFEVMTEWYNECKQVSAELMEESMNLRTKYIENVLKSLEKSPTSPKKGKGDKKKKNKK